MAAFALRSCVRAFVVLCSAGLFACDDGGSCVLTENLQGEWRGSYAPTGKPTETFELHLVDDGSRITGNFTTTDGSSGSLTGLQSGQQVVFELLGSSLGDCSGEMTGSAKVCGNSFSFQMQCEGEPSVSGVLTRKVDACKYANDGECDEPALCDEGTDTADCMGSDTCAFRNNGICDEPEGTFRCDDGTDATDCAGFNCPFTNNGICNEPEGTGECVEGTDFDDCNFTGNCPFQNDGVCDEPEGTGDCADGTDFNDCNPVMMPFCPFQNDGVCDEPEGTFRCVEGTDFNDCNMGSFCAFTNNGVCDEPEGTGNCSEGTDFNDCASCTRQNDQVCDEPEGTGLCSEGTDINDCSTSTIVCNFVECSVLDPSGLGQLDACCTAQNTCGVQFVGSACTAIETPTTGSCEPYTTPISTTPLDACCRPNGMCGIDISEFSTDGCVAVSAFELISIDELPCDADSDAGVE